VLVAVMLALPAWWVRRQSTPSPNVSEMSCEAEAQISSDSVSAEPTAIRSCLQRLPPVLGTDLIAAQSELQYVRIYTTLGDALVLGALKDVAEQREAEGQIVHRTWWVSNRHIRTLRRKGTQYVLTMNNGLEVPVSRRRQQGLIRQFGSSTTLN
jgi:DNA-binding LytR/AlgR family response regulator